MNRVYTSDELKELLDNVAHRINTSAFIETDPIQFPHRFALKQDIEISAFLTATIAWGKRPLILKSASEMHRIMGESPYDYIMEKGFEKLSSGNIHRTFFESDMAYLCRGLYTIYNKYDSIETLFLSSGTEQNNLWDGIWLFRNYIQQANDEINKRSLKHISNPISSACKRLHLALRWLVRNDGIVDLGLWLKIPPSLLQIPLDVHVSHTARRLGLLKRMSNDRKSVEELTEQLRFLNPHDPVFYDFALFGIGISQIKLI